MNRSKWFDASGVYLVLACLLTSCGAQKREMYSMGNPAVNQAPVQVEDAGASSATGKYKPVEAPCSEYTAPEIKKDRRLFSRKAEPRTRGIVQKTTAIKKWSSVIRKASSAKAARRDTSALMVVVYVLVGLATMMGIWYLFTVFGIVTMAWWEWLLGIALVLLMGLLCGALCGAQG